jgi:hypothetical protein
MVFTKKSRQLGTRISLISKQTLSGSVLATAMFLALLSRAEADISKKIVTSSPTTEVVIDPGSKETVQFWTLSKGNSSTRVGLRVSAPVGAVVTFEASAAKRGSDVVNVAPRNWFPIVLRNEAGRGNREESSFVVRRAEGLSSQSSFLKTFSTYQAAAFDMGLGFCGVFTDEQIATVLQQIEKSTGQKWTKEQFCKYTQSGGEEGVEIPNDENGQTPVIGTLPKDDVDEEFLKNQNNGTVDVAGVLPKDSCNERVTRYFLRIRVDLSGVDAALHPQGINLRLRASESKYTGKKAASIKPVSDGKYAPAPLLLMSSLGSNERLSIMRWKKGKPTKQAEVDVENRLYYRGYLLSRSIASNVLTGGYASVDKSSDYQSYGVCLNMVKSRQRINGYPG